MPPSSPDFSGFGKSVASGVFVGLNALAHAVSLSALVFFGPLSSGATWGSMLMIGVCVISTLALMLRGADTVILGAVQTAPLAYHLPFILALSRDAGQGVSEADAVLLIFSVLGLTAIVTGLVMLLTAWLDLGRLVKLVPYPVTAGFLASAGALLIAASVQLLLPRAGITTLLDGTVPWMDITNLALAGGVIVIMFVLSRWLRDYGALVAFLIALAIFYAGVWMTSVSIDQLRADHILPDAITVGTFQPDIYALWGLSPEPLIAALPSIIGAALVSVFGLMFNLTGVELASRKHIEARPVLLNSGLTNIATGTFGGAVSYPSAVNTVSALHVGRCTRTTALAYCAVLLIGVVGAGVIVPALPIFATAGLMGFIGCTIVHAWWFSPAARLSRSDTFIIGLIVLTTLLFGMLAAIFIGIIVACLMFAVIYARLPVFRRIDTLARRHSSVDRSPAQMATLDAHGGEVHVLTLQGYLFFGSCEQILLKTQDLLVEGVRPTTLIFDLNRVYGLDSAAVSTLEKLNNLAINTGFQVILSEARGEVLEQLRRKGFAGEISAQMHYSPSTDKAIEEAEDDLLRLYSPKDVETSARATLRDLLDDPELADDLLAYMELRTLAPGERLIAFGGTDKDVYLIDCGRLAINIKTAMGSEVRVRSLRAGSFVGEIASYARTPRTADVVAEVETRVYCASQSTLMRAVETDPHLASAWHKVMATNLADKLQRTTTLLSETS